MKPSLSWILGGVLVASLAAKFLMASATPAVDTRTFNEAAAAMLRADGFSVAAESRPFGTLLHGTRAGCRVVLGEDDPHGTFAELYRRLAAPVGPLRFAWRGTVYSSPPRRAALIRFYVWRELRRIGLRRAREPIAAWAASTACKGTHLQWSRLAVLSD